MDVPVGSAVSYGILLDGYSGKAMTFLSDIYNGRILELAGNIPFSARLEHPDATARAHSKLCGSTIEVDLKMDGDRVTEYGQKVKACLLGQSAAAIMGHNIIGATSDELRQVRAEMADMLKENGPPPGGKWADLALLEPVRDFKARHTSTLLVFDAVLDAIAQIEAERAASSEVVMQAADTGA